MEDNLEDKNSNKKEHREMLELKDASNYFKSIKKTISRDYMSTIKNNKDLLKFDEIINRFFEKYFSSKHDQPIEIIFTVLYNPEEINISEPIIKVFYQDNESFDLIKYKTEIESKLREFLAEISKNETDYIELWKLSKKIPIFIRRC
jgi:hypothetical protein